MLSELIWFIILVSILKTSIVSTLSVYQVQISPERTSINSQSNYELKITFSVNISQKKSCNYFKKIIQENFKNMNLKIDFSSSEIQSFNGSLQLCYFSNLEGNGNLTSKLLLNKK
jgi:hypothetical protein